MSFTVIDWVFGIIILAFALTSLVKGFIESVFNKLSWILGLIAAFILYKDVSVKFFNNIENPTISRIVSFVILFILVFLIVKLVQTIMERIFEMNILNSLDRVLGFAFGIIEGCAVVGLIIFLLYYQPFFSVEKIFDGSFFYGIFYNLFLASKETKLNV